MSPTPPHAPMPTTERRSRTLATLRDTAATLERLQAAALRRDQHGHVADLEERLLVLHERIAGLEAPTRRHGDDDHLRRG